jgi:hypothetical protein
MAQQRSVNLFGNTLLDDSELLKRKEEPEESDADKMKLADIPEHIKGRKRLEGETDDDYRLRQRNEKKLMKLRLKHGVSYARPKKQIINTEKKILKQQRQLKKDNRKRMAKAKKSM